MDLSYMSSTFPSRCSYCLRVWSLCLLLCSDRFPEQCTFNKNLHYHFRFFFICDWPAPTSLKHWVPHSLLFPPIPLIMLQSFPTGVVLPNLSQKDCKPALLLASPVFPFSFSLATVSGMGYRNELLSTPCPCTTHQPPENSGYHSLSLVFCMLSLL